MLVFIVIPLSVLLTPLCAVNNKSSLYIVIHPELSTCVILAGIWPMVMGPMPWVHDDMLYYSWTLNKSIHPFILWLRFNCNSLQSHW